MSFWKDVFDDALGFDPGGGGIYSVARDILGDTIADDWLGMDPNGGGAIGAYNAIGPAVLAYYGLPFLAETAGLGEAGAAASGAEAGAAAGGAEGTTAAMQGGFGETIAPQAASLATDAVSAASNFGMDSAAAYDAGLSNVGTNLGGAPVVDMSASAVPGLNNPMGTATPSFGQGAADYGLAKLSTMTPSSALNTAGSLYSMYSKNQMAKAQQRQADMLNSQIAQISSMYAPGSPEYNQMMQQIARKDAAAGRNSQYGVRAQNLAGIIAQQKANMLPGISSMTNTANQIQNQALTNRYGSLSSLFALGGTKTAPTAR